MTKKAKIGRPPGKPGENRERALNVRFKPEERRKIESAASAVGESLSAWARRTLLRAAE